MEQTFDDGVLDVYERVQADAICSFVAPAEA